MTPDPIEAAVPPALDLAAAADRLAALYRERCFRDGDRGPGVYLSAAEAAALAAVERAGRLVREEYH